MDVCIIEVHHSRVPRAAFSIRNSSSDGTRSGDRPSRGTRPFHEWSQMVNRGTNQQSSAPYNRRIVLDVIRRHGSLSRKEIVDRVALSPQTVANITADRESVGLVAAGRLWVQKSRGQPPIVFELNPNGGTSIGITIEPGRARAGVGDPVGEGSREQGGGVGP